MSEKRTSYARKPETYATIDEALSVDPLMGGYIAANGLPIQKIMLLGMVEGKEVGARSSTLAITDGGRSVINITAFGDAMGKVEMVEKGSWILVTGNIRYDKIKKHLYITPTLVEQIEQGQLRSFMSWWYLNLIKLRCMAEMLIPKTPCGAILDERGIDYKIENGWIKLNRKEAQQGARRIIREGDGEKNAERTKVISYFQETDEVNINEYIAWATENKIRITQAEGLLVDLTNDGIIKEIGDNHDTFKIIT